MSLCTICLNPGSIDYPLVAIDSHDNRHRFHNICLYNFFQYQGLCPLCRERVRLLNDPREAPPAYNVNAAAQGIFVQQHPLIKAICEDRPIDSFLAGEEIARWTLQNAIRLAALHGRQSALQTLTKTDADRGIAIPFLIPHHINLIPLLMEQAENRNKVSNSALKEAAIAGHQEALNHLIQNDRHRALAISYAAPKYMELVETLFNKANNPKFVRKQAIINAVLDNRRSSLNALIQTDIHRGLAIALVAPDNMDLVQDLLDNGNDPNFVREEAIIYAALNNRGSALSSLIQTDRDRGIAIAFVAPDNMDLAQSLLDNGSDPNLVRAHAIINAALNNRGSTLNFLVQSDKDRALAAAFAAPDYMGLVQDLFNNANDKKSIRNEAISFAILNNRGSALNTLIQTDRERGMAIALAAPDNMDLVQDLLNNGNEKNFVREEAIIFAALNNRESTLSFLIETDKDRELAAAFAAPDLAQTLLNSANDKN